MSLCRVDSNTEPVVYYNKETKVISLSCGLAAEEPLTYKKIRLLNPNAVQVSAENMQITKSYLKKISQEAKNEYEGWNGFFKQLHQRFSNLIITVWFQHKLIWATNAKVISEFAKSLQTSAHSCQPLTEKTVHEVDLKGLLKVSEEGEGRTQGECAEKTDSIEDRQDKTELPSVEKQHEEEVKKEEKADQKEVDQKVEQEKANAAKQTEDKDKDIDKEVVKEVDDTIENRVNEVFEKNKTAVESNSAEPKEEKLPATTTFFSPLLNTITKINDYFTSSSSTETTTENQQQAPNLIVNEQRDDVDDVIESDNLFAPLAGVTKTVMDGISGMSTFFSTSATPAPSATPDLLETEEEKEEQEEEYYDAIEVKEELRKPEEQKEESMVSSLNEEEVEQQDELEEQQYYDAVEDVEAEEPKVEDVEAEEPKVEEVKEEESKPEEADKVLDNQNSVIPADQNQLNKIEENKQDEKVEQKQEESYLGTLNANFWWLLGY